MEEADVFIREACRHLECSFSDDEQIEFSTPQVFEFLVRCIWRIDSSSKAVIPSYVYPKVITGRLHLGNKISDYLQKLNIRGDIALHTVLYGNINSLRSAFIELIRKLPADTQETVDEDRNHAFFAKILGVLEAETEWVPVYCRGLNKGKDQWVPIDNSPEYFPLFSSNRPVQNDPRKWIAQYVNSKDQGRVSVLRNAKPAVPPKPVLVRKKEQSEEQKEDENTLEQENDTDEVAALEAKYAEKLEEYKTLQERRTEVEEKSEHLRRQILEYDPELIKAMGNPEYYAEHFLKKIAELNEQMETDVAVMEQRKSEAAQRELKLSERMREMGLLEEDMKKVEGMEATLSQIDEKIEYNLALAVKLRKKLAETNEDNFYEYEKRSNDLDEMVRKQENDMIRMQEERAVLRKQEERENEAVNRSFAIIYNILLQHCDHYRGRLAMESFTRIHLYCMEIMEMLRENGALKQAVACLQSEIIVEEQKHYGKQFELLKQDYEEIAALNENLLAEIRIKDPSFELPKI